MNMGRIVFGYHAGRAGLDENGGLGTPVGLDDIRESGYTHVGIPMHHTGSYVNELVDAGVRIIRTIEGQWNPGLNRHDLGQIILDWNSVHRPGQFLENWLTQMQDPCHGFAWNLEHDILTPGKYPIISADRTLARRWRLNLDDIDDYVTFRCRQFATIIRLMKKMGVARWGKKFIVIAYSEYGTGRARTEYGCDWDMLADPFLKLGKEALPLINYAHCNYFGAVRLIAEYAQWVQSYRLPVLHNIQLPEPWNTVAGFSGQVADRLQLMHIRQRDGFGSCDARNPEDRTHVWDDADRDVARIITRALKLAQDPGVTILRSMGWAHIKKSVQ